MPDENSQQEEQPVLPSDQESRRPTSPSYPPSPWTWRDIAVAIAVDVAIAVGMVLIGFALGGYVRAKGARLPSSAAGVLAFLSEFSLLAVVWLLVLRKHGLTWRSVGFRRFDAMRSLGLGCLFLFFSISFNFVWGVLVSSLAGRPVQPDLLPFFGGGLSGLVVALAIGGVVAPISEEAFFRGYLFAGLRSRSGFRRALVLSALIFALGHVVPTSWPPIFVLGLLFGALYQQTGSIWPGVVLHGAINSSSLLLSYLSQTFGR